MRKLATALTAAVLASFAFTANAQDHQPFTGFYAGVETGLVHTNDVVILDVPFEGTDGVWYGGFLGGRYQFDNGLVIGAEGYAGDSSNSTTLLFDVPDVGIVPVEFSAGRTLGIDGIIGFAASDRVLIFGHAGYINTRFKAIIEGVDSIAENEGDLRFGGGFEVKVLDNVGLRAKVSYVKFDDDLKVLQALFGAVLTW